MNRVIVYINEKRTIRMRAKIGSLKVYKKISLPASLSSYTWIAYYGRGWLETDFESMATKNRNSEYR